MLTLKAKAVKLLRHNGLERKGVIDIGEEHRDTALGIEGRGATNHRIGAEGPVFPFEHRNINQLVQVDWVKFAHVQRMSDFFIAERMRGGFRDL